MASLMQNSCCFISDMKYLSGMFVLSKALTRFDTSNENDWA